MSIRVFRKRLALGLKWVMVATLLALGVGSGVYIGYSFVLGKGTVADAPSKSVSSELSR
jgi:hypothetical protein